MFPVYILSLSYNCLCLYNMLYCKFTTLIYNLCNILKLYIRVKWEFYKYHYPFVYIRKLPASFPFQTLLFLLLLLSTTETLTLPFPFDFITISKRTNIISLKTLLNHLFALFIFCLRYEDLSLELLLVEIWKWRSESGEWERAVSEDQGLIEC